MLGRVGRKQSDRWKLNDSVDLMRRGGWWAPPARPRPRAAPAPAQLSVGDLPARLRELAELRSAGALTDAEFCAQKKLLLEG